MSCCNLQSRVSALFYVLLHFWSPITKRLSAKNCDCRFFGPNGNFNAHFRRKLKCRQRAAGWQHPKTLLGLLHTYPGRQAGRGGVKKTNDKHICTLLQLERVLDSFLFHTPPFLPRLAASFSAAAAVESQQAVMTEAHR